MNGIWVELGVECWARSDAWDASLVEASEEFQGGEFGVQFARVVATDSAQGRNAVVVVQGVEFLDVTAFGFGGCKLVGFDDFAGLEGVVVPGPAKLVALEQEAGLAGDLRIIVACGLADLC